MTCSVKTEILHINGEPVERRRVEDYIATGPLGRTIQVSQYVETLPDRASYHVTSSVRATEASSTTPASSVGPATLTL